jgi:hypothetical protein
MRGPPRRASLCAPMISGPRPHHAATASDEKQKL